MPTLLNFSGENELYNGRSFYPSGKRARISASSILWSEESEQERKSGIDVLPDECLFEIFRRLPAEERCAGACVSKHWLTLLSSIRRCENDSVIPSKVDGSIAKTLEGKKATDIRLAAITVGAAGRGGLGKLTIRGSNATRGVTDLGLSAISCGCPSLRSLTLCNVPLVGDEGLSNIAKGCRMLERLDVYQCASITNKGLIAIAENCSNLTSLSIESCANIGNDGLKAIAQGCPMLETITIKDCPLVGDQGITSLLSSPSSVLSKVKLQGLNISDFSLAVIGHYGKSLTCLTLCGLENVSERGFWAMGNAGGLNRLVSLTIGSCFGVTDFSLQAIARSCSSNLKHLTLRKCSVMSDNGLSVFVRSLESLHLEDCNTITIQGLISCLSCSNLKSLSVVKCTGVRDMMPFQTTLQCTCVSLRSLSIKNCPSFGSASLTVFGKMCPNLTQVELNRLYGITDDGILSLIESSLGGLVKLNLNGCINVSDLSILTLARVHGETLKALNLNGCRRITDTSLLAIARSFSLLIDLDISKCSITDSGIAALSCSEDLNLQILSISGCSKVSNKSLPSLIQMGANLIGLNLMHCSSLTSKTLNTLVGDLWNCDILC